MKPQTKKTEMQLNWLRVKRHLRSCNTSARALRDASRALSTTSETAIGVALPARSRLCRGTDASSHRLAA